MRVEIVRRVGIFGGTFDPIHYGHLVAASEVVAQCGLDEVVFVPTGDPWQKVGREVAGADDRLAMTRIAVENDARFSVSTVDIDRDGFTYAVDTVADVRAAHDAPVELSFIIGADTLEKLHTWHRIEDLYKSVEFIAVNRPGHSRSRVELPDDARVRFVDMPGVDISSSECRRRIREGRPVRYLLPDLVDVYIADHGLYR
jgi:nicotinate-nucleotide adenylyltransferase